jgi:hypothetical protein
MVLCMCMLSKRTNILFSEPMWDGLSELAQREGSSVGELVRLAVEEQYFKPGELLKALQTKRRRQALATVATVHSQLREKFSIKDIQRLISNGRKY